DELQIVGIVSNSGTIGTDCISELGFDDTYPTILKGTRSDCMSSGSPVQADTNGFDNVTFKARQASYPTDDDMDLIIGSASVSTEDSTIYEYTLFWPNGSCEHPPCSACGNDGNGDPIKALPLKGVWSLDDGSYSSGDDSQFTFSCKNAAIG